MPVYTLQIIGVVNLFTNVAQIKNSQMHASCRNFRITNTAKITLIEMGWPGSILDKQVWSNTDVNLSKEKYFSDKEYLIGDSAFSASSVMVTAFKMGQNANLSKE